MDFSRPLTTVTPTLDGDVLAVLAAADLPFTSGQVHRVLNQFSQEGIRKVLTRLVVQGVVNAERAGNAFTYRLNRDHLAAPPILALAGMRSALFKKIGEQLKEWHPQPVYAAVFGSVATGKASVHSDIDLLLVRDDDHPDNVWLTQIDQLTTDVTRWTGNETRVVEYAYSDFRAARHEPMIVDVIDHGLTVAGSRAWLIKNTRLNRPRNTEL